MPNKHLTDTQVTVLPRVRVRGWDGDPSEKQTIAHFEPVTLKDALETRYAGEACLVQYVHPLGKELPRLNKSALAAIACQPEREQPECQVFLFDVDYPNHKVPHEGWAAETIAQVPEEYLEFMGWYRTPHGLRLIFLPPSPVRLLEAASVIEWWHRRFREWDVPVDYATKDAQRLFKAPHALKRDLPYNWDSLAPLPSHLFLSQNQRSVADPTSLGSYVQGEQPSKADLAGFKITRKDVRLLRDKALAEHLYEQRLSAPEGERHETLLNAAIRITEDTEQVSPEFAFKILAKSLSSMNSRAGRDIELPELWRICDWACAQVAGKREELASSRSTYFEELANVLNIPADEARSCVILDSGSQYYVFDEETRDYSFGYTNQRQLLPALRRHAPAVYYDVDTKEQALEFYSSPVSKVTRSYLHDQARYDLNTYQLTLPAARVRRDLQPTYHSDVHGWLVRLAPDEMSRSRFLDWLAAFPDLSLPTCALYLDGPKSIGKGLLAYGLAQVWGAMAPTGYKALIRSFNPELINCPLVVADESVPRDAFSEDDSGIFRRLVGSPTHRTEGKYQTAVELQGYLRVLITANNDGALQIRETLSKKDLEAVQLRIGYIQLSESGDGSCPPRDYLENLVDEKDAQTVRDVTQSWIDDGLIAEHVLWLAQNRDYIPGARFAVQGWQSDLTRDLATSHGATPAIATVVCSAVVESLRRWDSVRWFGGYVYVSSRMLPKEQDMILGYKRRKFSESSYVDTLKALANEESHRLKTSDGAYRRYWKIPGEELARFAERNGLVGSREEFEQIVGRESEDEDSLPVGRGMKAINQSKKPEN